jgi:hypothetical protein
MDGLLSWCNITGLESLSVLQLLFLCNFVERTTISKFIWFSGNCSCSSELWDLTEEGKQVAKDGRQETQVFDAIPSAECT